MISSYRTRHPTSLLLLKVILFLLSVLPLCVCFLILMRSAVSLAFACLSYQTTKFLRMLYRNPPRDLSASQIHWYLTGTLQLPGWISLFPGVIQITLLCTLQSIMWGSSYVAWYGPHPRTCSHTSSCSFFCFGIYTHPAIGTLQVLVQACISSSYHLDLCTLFCKRLLFLIACCDFLYSSGTFLGDSCHAEPSPCVHRGYSLERSSLLPWQP